ncbi:cyclic pyranopterin monophosphate synthase, mitochondrial isoform X1 [Ricinus communis]|uniref:cyclic pyranopterin monophosphate synthase, mitochondrial isoform X1 n=1 Tax=Ricinus communis TaxID=3988 RepID=UPI000772B24F|nr:cyclic pyranopterin monophosphate synthase, mitochondrial isoform X1 [Ricinus communis]XP_015577973.1 cyclic pyranopterin monophosphate synthase, mitochondrial isoform X1 [Ricinus communis]XP_025014058.1 cyclic pyranopterin monophosphate synthase, mitochondrial isoform X1 [Ricinus communis]XP_025014059.1 cyclic pyranopterin monophosphate synthase, mitochondrial isoform X1 [Ricinus communis]XP_025014060.1 cyclic pyranopterin monophosphate synthase, mitochondrial isoform X1 [Ricinus communis]|eukprot:XP_015577972.1 cyclic pyranopterin monophosphate synthase, mitochondrial isoform X1 [Ricinus communis]
MHHLRLLYQPQGAFWIFSAMFLRRAAVTLPYSRSIFSAKNTHDLASAITEMNKEMESVFGETPSGGGFSGSLNNNHMLQEPQVSPSDDVLAQDSQSISDSMNQNAFGLTHVSSSGEAQMVDVSPKENSKRTAIATCKVLLGKKVFDMVLANQMAKGDVLTVAKIAGINGAKHTSSLIPLCHNIILSHVRVDLMLNPDNYSVEVEGEASSSGKTGVEMEALTAVSIAGLTVYDMCKAASKEIQITDVRLERKTGGKSGDWHRNTTIPTRTSTKNDKESDQVLHGGLKE